MHHDLSIHSSTGIALRRIVIGTVAVKYRYVPAFKGQVRSSLCEGTLTLFIYTCVVLNGGASPSVWEQTFVAVPGLDTRLWAVTICQYG
jgi:hypothetical protein